IFAKLIRVDGSEGYNSLLITHKDSPYKSVDDVLKNSKEINFGIGDPNSTSGFLVPSYYVFAKNNVDPKTAFKTIRGANHATNFMAAANKQVDVATFNTEDYEKMEHSQPEMVKNIRIIWKSALIPADPFVWRKDLPADLKTKIKNFMVTYAKGADAAGQKEKIKMIPAGGFAASNDDQLIPIRQIALFSARVKLQNDANMDASEKSKKIDQINRQLDELGQKLALAK
ncbi:MAG: phosphate/phosphite/phosphonate ABC transporter substrate-binding protein, partial [Polaromonas sp.]